MELDPSWNWHRKNKKRAETVADRLKAIRQQKELAQESEEPLTSFEIRALEEKLYRR